MKFWDASAIVYRCWSPRRRQSSCKRARNAIPTCWHGGVRPWECAFALARLERDTALDTKSAELAFRRLRLIADAWHEVELSELVRENAARFLRVHPLRAADALQLAAAFVAAERRPASLQVVTLDERLADAMRKEGFALVDIAPE